MKTPTDADISTTLSRIEAGVDRPPFDRDKSCGKLTRGFFEWIEMFSIAITVVWLLLTVLFRFAVVDGDSMLQTLNDRDTLLISNINYTPTRGDIIVFQLPDSGIDTPIVKRIVALEGDVVDIDYNNWAVTVNGEASNDSFIKKDADEPMLHGDVSFPYTVPQGCMFVLGDNRNDSWDSRYETVGAVDTRYILGHVIVRVFPFSAFGQVD